MVEFSKETVQQIKESWEKNGVNPEFGALAGSILDELAGDETVSANPKYNKFAAGTVSMSKDKISSCEIKTAKGTAIWDKQRIIADEEEIGIMFKLEGNKALYCFHCPNPKVANDKLHDWCMATFADITAALVVKRGV